MFSSTIEMATAGIAQDYGDLTIGPSTGNFVGFLLQHDGVFAGGDAATPVTNTIDYITIATTVQRFRLWSY